MTTITYNNATLTLTQQAYYAGDVYEALATDTMGNQYLVKWTNERPEAEDESDACNWDQPVAVIKL